jgi:glycosyltransferase involved in cell wall biosynthesis
VRPVLVSHSGALTAGSNETIASILRHRPPDADVLCVVLEDGPFLDRLRDLGVDARILPSGRAREVWRAPLVVAGLRGLIREHRADVVFAHISKAQIYAGPAAALTGVPSLWRQCEFPGRPLVLQELAARLPAEAVVATSAHVARRHRRRWPRTPVHLVYSGLPTDDLGPPRRHVASRDANVIVVSRFERWKRVELALEGFALALAQEPGLRLTVVGGPRPGPDEAYADELRALAVRLAITHSVDFLGPVPRAAERIAEADVLLHTADREPFGLVQAEALLRGVPVIAPSAGVGPEVVRHGVDGLLVDPTDRTAVAAAVLELTRHPDRRAVMGESGRRMALERFNERRMAAETWDVVADVIRRGVRPRRGQLIRSAWRPRRARPSRV